MSILTKCKRCGLLFDYDCLLLKHLKKEIICKPKVNNISRDILIEEINNKKPSIIINDKKVYVCKFCNKVFNSNTSKNRHMKTCKFNQSKNSNINNSLNTNISGYNNPNNSNINGSSNNINNSKNDSHDTNLNNCPISINNNTNTNNNIKLDSHNLLNAYISANNLGTLFKPFPSYTIGHILQNMFAILNDTIKKCKKEDHSKQPTQDSRYNLVLEIFKEIMKADDIQTKNMYINNIEDTIAFCCIEGQFYTIGINELFDIICHHLPNIITQLKKTKDQYNGMDKDDKDYTEFANSNFKEFVNNSKTDKTHLKEEIIKCIYNNKFALEKLINSSNPIDEFNKNAYKIIKIESPAINKLRKRYGFKPNNNENEETIFINDKDIKHRKNNSIKINIEENNEELDDEPIIINYENTINKYLADGKICYKTQYNGVDIWYNEKSEIGCLYIDKRHNLMPIDELKKIINNMINGTLRIYNGTQVNTEEPINNDDSIDNGFLSDDNY